MAGDSITDAGRSRPLGRAPYGLGGGYVALVQAMLAVEYRTLGQGLDIINAGIGGNTSRDLAQRWSEDVLKLSPRWITVMIGVNDVWRKFDHPDQPELHVAADEYRIHLRKLVTDALAVVEGVTLIAPFLLEPNRSDPMRTMLDGYREAVREVAGDVGQPLFDPQGCFDDWLVGGGQELSPDRVHPNLTGHFLLARGLVRVWQQHAWLPDSGATQPGC